MAFYPTQILDALRDQLNVVDDADRDLLGRLCHAAAAHTGSNIGVQLDDAVEFPTGIPADLQQAVLMLAAHWYENREATLVGVAAQSTPFGYDEIVRNHRSYTFG